MHVDMIKAAVAGDTIERCSKNAFLCCSFLLRTHVSKATNWSSQVDARKNRLFWCPNRSAIRISFGHSPNSFLLQKVQNDLKQFTAVSSYQTGRKVEVPKKGFKQSEGAFSELLRCETAFRKMVWRVSSRNLLGALIAAGIAWPRRVKLSRIADRFGVHPLKK